MKILGLDPGTTLIGFAVMENDGSREILADYGCIKTRGALPEKLTELRNDLQKLIREHKPDCCIVERLFFAKNRKTALSVAHARGVTLEIMQKEKIPVYEVHPNEVKMAVTGYGASDKKNMQKMVGMLFRFGKKPRHDDTIDAIAIALTGSRLHSLTKTHA